ncbi:MAG: aryl-sulfate sulfotransferase [Myxococcota bacterium]
MRACHAPLIFAIALASSGCPADDTDKPDDSPGTDSPSTTDTETTMPTGTTGTTGDTGGSTTAPPTLAVSCDPTDNPLRFLCTVDVDPAQPVQLVYARADGLSATRTVTSDLVQSQHELPVYFLAPEQVYDLTVSATAWPDDTIPGQLTAGSMPADFRSSLTMTGTSTMGMIGSHDPCSGEAVAVVYDTNTGDLVWFELMNPGGQFGSLDMVVFTDDHTVLGESTGDVIEVDLMGEDLVRLDNLDDAFGVNVGGPFGNFHHDIAKRDGVYYVFYQESYGGNDVLDTVILFDGLGTELARWYPIDHLPIPGNWGGDYLHTNSIWVDEAYDIHLSWLSLDSVAKIEGDWTSPDFGTPIWILDGDAGGGMGTITTDWSAVGGPDEFGGQHSFLVRPDGRLQLLDNDSGRGLVIDLDEVAGTATVDAEYETHENGCGPQGTSRSTLGGNAVVACTGDWVREFDGVSGEMLWEAEVQCPGGGSPGSSRWYPLDGW